jgi:hypothetical protein
MKAAPCREAYFCLTTTVHRVLAMCPQNSRYILHMAKYQCLQKKMKEAKNTMEALDIKEGIPIAQIL